LFVSNGPATLNGCVVSNNAAIMPDIGPVIETSTGGGIDCESGALSLNNCQVTSNTAAGAGLSFTELGGGIYLDNIQATLAAVLCSFTGNSAPGGFGGAAALGDGGMANCVFTGNLGTYGGGSGSASGSAQRIGPADRGHI
jgi:hypothetical protein